MCLKRKFTNPETERLRSALGAALTGETIAVLMNVVEWGHWDLTRAWAALDPLLSLNGKKKAWGRFPFPLPWVSAQSCK